MILTISVDLSKVKGFPTLEQAIEDSVFYPLNQKIEAANDDHAFIEATSGKVISQLEPGLEIGEWSIA